MYNALAEPTLNALPERPVHRRPTALLIATDGTPQSDAAIALARLLPPGNQRDVKALTVVDHAPIPDYSARTKADIIALATSGCGGMSRLAFGTVADEVNRKSTSSLLVFHPKVPFEIDAGEPSCAKALAGVRHD